MRAETADPHKEMKSTEKDNNMEKHNFSYYLKFIERQLAILNIIKNKNNVVRILAYIKLRCIAKLLQKSKKVKQTHPIEAVTVYVTWFSII